MAAKVEASTSGVGLMANVKTLAPGLVMVGEVAALEIAVAVIVVHLPRMTRIYFVKVPVRNRFKHC